MNRDHELYSYCANNTADAAPPPTDATPRAPARAARASGFLFVPQWLQNLSPFAKGAFVVVLILLAVAWYIFTGRVTTDDAQVDCHITAVAPQVPGYVVQLFINDNTPVKEGDLMVQIDARPYEAEVEQAKANLDFAEAQANSAKLQITFDARNHYSQHRRRHRSERIRRSRLRKFPGSTRADRDRQSASG